VNNDDKSCSTEPMCVIQLLSTLNTLVVDQGGPPTSHQSCVDELAMSLLATGCQTLTKIIRQITWGFSWGWGSRVPRGWSESVTVCVQCQRVKDESFALDRKPRAGRSGHLLISLLAGSTWYRIDRCSACNARHPSSAAQRQTHNNDFVNAAQSHSDIIVVQAQIDLVPPKRPALTEYPHIAS